MIIHCAGSVGVGDALGVAVRVACAESRSVIMSDHRQKNPNTSENKTKRRIGFERPPGMILLLLII
jgi:hypothetical protein